MKRFHVHVGVEDLDASIRFSSALFGAEPTVRKSDYAKWMVEDPRLNFAISRRGEGRRVGVNHLGLQVDSDAELEALRSQAEHADLAAAAEKGVNCCYATSNKYWYTDPTGLPWETYHSLGQVEFFGDERVADKPSACCAPAAVPVPSGVRAKSASCCS
ncbi:MAG: ArsI/CadI family heavy metal resistance metalloenzyme [Burkholderiaceae bacterium]